ncbi:MAG: GHMP kinase [Planctomycetes bacterium]|nr:GHMP kinase [Planctomycetota bacterium]
MIIQSRAANRILDFGGWTDTHFAGHGKVLNVAVTLFANVTVRTVPGRSATIDVQDYDEKVFIQNILRIQYDGQHDILKAALKVMNIEHGVEVSISADVPPGCGTGSSAAISVALINALSVLSGQYLAAHEIAQLAHRIETKELGYECGIQDQYASAYGGVNLIEMSSYPTANVSPIVLSSEMIANLETQLLLVYEGKGHLSSDVHRKVIEGLRDPQSTTARALDGLRSTAEEARRSLMRGDLRALADAMDYNNALQKQLHPAITTENLERIEAVARARGAIGAMINGAGGGGSITLLCRPGKKIEVAAALRAEEFRILPFSLALKPAHAWVVSPAE